MSGTLAPGSVRNVHDEALTYRQRTSVGAVAPASAGVDGTTHDMRHFYASALIAGGASVETVQTLLGHATPTITLRTYAPDGGLTAPADGSAAGQRV